MRLIGLPVSRVVVRCRMPKTRRTVTLMALAVFCGDLSPDPASAAANLRQAGYQVFM